MRRKLALYLVGSALLASLAGCGRGWMAAEQRDPWRLEAEVACLKSGAVKSNVLVTPVKAIEGPGICGAEYPLKVAGVGTSSPLGYSDELRPPGAVLRGFPIAEPRRPLPMGAAPQPASLADGDEGNGGPMSLRAPGVASPGPGDEDELEAEGEETIPAANGAAAQRDPYGLSASAPAAGARAQRPQSPDQPAAAALPPLGPSHEGVLAFASGPAAVSPTATLACPMVSALDHWMAEAVQPAAQRWFGQPVVEIKQISAYSCRGMNGQRGAPISEHAFGNALDIAAFVFADGRRVVVKGGWQHGAPEEQGFLRDVQGAACARFSTVLAPGSNVYHYDHIHVDLARHRSRRAICKPAAVSGELIARRARGDIVTGSIGPGWRSAHSGGRLGFAPEMQADGESGSKLPRAIPGAD